jgi:hypothetical protein
LQSERGLAPSCFGATFDRPLQVIGTGVHVNRLPEAPGDPAATEPGNGVLSGVKKAETGDEFVVRLYETQGTRRTTSVQLKDTIFGEVDHARDSIGFEGIACFSRDRRVGPREALAEHPERLPPFQPFRPVHGCPPWCG